MNSFLFILTFVTVPLFCIILLKLTDIRILDIKIPNIFLMFYFINAYIGIFPLYFYWDKYRYTLGVTNRQIIFKVLVYTSVSLIFIIVGLIICRQLWKLKLKRNIKETRDLSKKTQLIIYLLFTISIIVLILYLKKLPAIPLLSAIKGSSFEELTRLRSMGGNSFQGKYHWYNLFMRQILLYLSYIAFSQAIIKKNKKDIFFFIVTFIISCFSCLMLNEKAPIVYYFMGLTFTFLISRQKKINFKSMVLISGLGLSFLSVMYMLFMNMKKRSLLDIFRAIASRLFAGSISPAYFYLEIFPRKQEFLIGRSFPNPRGIFPWEHYRITVEVMNYIAPHLSSVGVTGSAPTVFWGEAYANFGLIGILFFSVVVGLFIYLFQYFIDRYKTINPIHIGAQVWLILEFQKLTFSGVSRLIFDLNLLVIMALTIILLHMESRRAIRINADEFINII